ncbi:MAG TPA: hypothetical protein DDZ44_05435 [Syntrophomonas wolfei]|jgi:hypothetical protein|uniref:Uncharacterized protein n=1 Tax=Syntrophomonas wolfei TaxID=863 RepID=A0A354YVH1_9FIRM|nr:hypothetical protein [Syntrophomonas wolfei]
MFIGYNINQLFIAFIAPCSAPRAEVAGWRWDIIKMHGVILFTRDILGALLRCSAGNNSL